jgi:hypothetical protein
MHVNTLKRLASTINQKKKCRESCANIRVLDTPAYPAKAVFKIEQSGTMLPAFTFFDEHWKKVVECPKRHFHSREVQSGNVGVEVDGTMRALIYRVLQPFVQHARPFESIRPAGAAMRAGEP